MHNVVHVGLRFRETGYEATLERTFASSAYVLPIYVGDFATYGLSKPTMVTFSATNQKRYSEYSTSTQ
jgi:hypothetical protein